MAWWELALLASAITALLAVVVAFLVWHRLSERTKRLGARVQALGWRNRLRLAAALTTDERIPPGVRLIPPLLVLYLAMPLDFVPDFIPLLGQLDDLAVLAVGVGLLVRFAPVQVIEAQLARFELQEKTEGTE